MTIVSAKVVDRLSMLITFSTGEVRLLDATQLSSMPVFELLNNQDIFENCTIEQGILTWCNGEIDIAPEALYRLSYKYDLVA